MYLICYNKYIFFLSVSGMFLLLLHFSQLRKFFFVIFTQISICAFPNKGCEFNNTINYLF